MPKRNPKRDQRSVSQHYRRAKERAALSGGKKDRTGLYYGLLFIGVIGVVVAVVLVLNPGWFKNEIHIQEGDVIDFNYIGMYASNETVFDEGILTGIELGAEPAQIIEYLEQSMLDKKMKIGEKASIIVPNIHIPNTPAYADLKGSGDDLLFEIVVVKIVRNGNTYE
ncbi:MAG: FKBP-type peptidyl-prolyl cis-trans isomerase [Candidatus Hodarchaeota archaeon]